MRKLILLTLAIGLLAASPALAAFTGSLYLSNFANHHVYRSDVTGGVIDNTIDLVGLPGADGLLFDPTDPNRILVGGQQTNNIYSTSIMGGGYSVVNSAPIPNGSLHLAVEPMMTLGGLMGPTTNETRVLTSGYEGPQPNSIAIVGLSTGTVNTHIITNVARMAGMANRDGTLYATDGEEYGWGGKLYKVNLATNLATLVPVINGHDMHDIWFDEGSGHMFAGGAYYVEEIDLDAVGGPRVVRQWDISGLLGPTPVPYLDHIDHITIYGGNLFAAVNTGPLINIDLGTGSSSLFHDYGVGLDAVLAGPSAIPEPSSLMLLGLGVVGLLAARRRQ